MALRVVVMSDIHGNLPALEAVAAAVPPHDQVVVAGDLCLEGPCPAQVLDFLLERGWTLIMGNTDRDIVETTSGTSSKQRMALWAREQLGAERIRRLAELPFSTRVGEEGGDALIVHANPRTIDQHLLPTMSEEELEPFLRDVSTEILAFGHYHVPYVRPVTGIAGLGSGGLLLVDVASVGHPKDRDLRAAFTLLEWENGRRAVTQYRVPYDVDRTVHLLRSSDMPEAEEEAASLLKASY